MSDLKNILLPPIDEPEKKHQPWYKERLKKRIDYVNSKNRKNKKNVVLDARQWVFVKDGLDDFRDGLPPPHDDILIKPQKGPNPTIKNDHWSFKQSALSPNKRFNVEQRCYSHALPMVQAKRDRIEELINGLASHPLALYAHLEESLPTDLFEEIIELLDPEMNQNFEDETNADETDVNDDTQSGAITIDSSKTPHDDSTKQSFTRTNTQYAETEAASTIAPASDKKSIRNTYKWLLKKEEAKEKAKVQFDGEDAKAQAIDNYIKQVTEDFCNWTQGLGGENNIDPVTLTSLFASGHETKPALSVPIHVVELTNIPPELRNSSLATSAKTKVQQNFIPDMEEFKTNQYNNEKFRYGAWYLPKNLWKVMPQDEKLIDPKLIIDKSKEEAKKKAEDMVIIISKLNFLINLHTFFSLECKISSSAWNKII